MRLFGLLVLLAVACSLRANDALTPHVVDQAGPQTITQGHQRFINHGLVGAGRLSADTIDFLGDTLGSFSSLAIQRGSWKRVGDHYEAILWTLPDRGRNDPGEKLFYDYAARLHRFKLVFTPYTGKPLPASTASQSQVRIVPDGGLALTDFAGHPLTGADPADGTTTQHGIVLPSPASGIGAGKISIDAESLQFTRDGHFYVGDEYGAFVYYFDAKGHLQGVLVPPTAVQPRDAQGHWQLGSLAPPKTGRRNNQGVEGMSLSPDGRRLFVVLQSALVQDTATGGAQGRSNTRILVYDVSHDALPSRPIGHYVVALPIYNDHGDGGPANKTAAQSEVRALNEHQLLMLSRDGNGLGTDNDKPIVYKSILLVDIDGASNLAGSAYETSTTSLLRTPESNALKEGITPARTDELINLLNRAQLSRFGLNLDTQPKNQPLTLAEKWEAMDLVSTLDPSTPHDYFLFVGNDNDFIARHCVMEGTRCDASFDNDSLLLVYRLTLPSMQTITP